MIIAVDARPLVRTQIQGPEQRARNILSAWAKSAQEHEFRLIYPRPAQGEAFDASLLERLPANFQREEISSYQLPSGFYSASRVLNALARSVRRIKADVYHSFTPEVPRIPCPVVPTLHDLAFELDPMVRRTPQGRELRRLTARSVGYAARIIAVSSQTKFDAASIYRFPSERIDVIYNGIDPAFTPLPPTALPLPGRIHADNGISRPYVLAVGADIPRRNYARMFAAMEIVWNSPGDGAQTQWVLAGRHDWNASEIMSLARQRGVLPKMRFVFNPNNEELADLYRVATLTCCASSFEGFGLSVLESMACGTAVACSDMRSLREVAAECAVYFPHDDAQAMGQAIAGLLGDAEYRRQLKYRGIERAKLFTWATGAQLTLASLAAAMQPGD
jgi:glycosyltransferase involved in cell wall biosynthesis